MEESKKYSTFDAFRPHFNALARVGYYKIVMKSVSPLKLKFHGYYMCFVWAIVLTYNLQHVIRVVEARDSTDQIVNTLFILLTTLNTLGKHIAFNARTSRIDKALDIINGPLFAPTKPYHVDVMKKNALAMSRLLTLFHGAIFTCGTLWAIHPLANRMLGKEVQFTGYFPFNTQNTPRFELALSYMTILITIQAYGNVTMDCTIVSFYAQIRTQLRILRYNMEHLVDPELSTEQIRYGKKEHVMSLGFKDIVDEEFEKVLKKRLTTSVQHYGQIVWFINEIASIFSEAAFVQFFVMAWVICMTVYKIVGLSFLSMETASLAVYLGAMMAQLFIYCYYGTQVKVESEQVNESIYSSGWVDLSPRFRRFLLILMDRCSRPISPTAAYVVPMSLATYTSVLRSSYTLFTILDRKS